MKFKDQFEVAAAAGKANQAVDMIQRNFCNVNKEMFITLYATIVSVLEPGLG